MKLLVSMLVILLCACGPDLALLVPQSHAQNKFNRSRGQKMHIEVEPSGQMSQVFYFVSPEDLAKGLTLHRSFQLRGAALGVKKYLDLDKAHERDSLTHFSDILALPKANKINFLSPRIPAISARLTNASLYHLNLQDGLSYAIILNPSGLYNRAPIYLNLDKPLPNNRLDFSLSVAGPRIKGQISSSNTKKDLWQARMIQGTRLVSSVAQVQKDGQFELELANQMFLGDDIPLTLLIEPQSQELTLPRLKKIFKASELYAHPDLGQINMGRFGKPMTIQIKTPGPGFIYLHSLIGAGEVLIKRPIHASGLTVFEGLYEGTYDLAVVPPTDSKYGMRVIEKVDFLGGNLMLSLKLPLRKMLMAKVVNALGETIRGAQVEFSRIGKIGAFATEDIFTDQLFPFTATTNEEGRVCQRQFGVKTAKPNDCAGLALDEGRYVAHIIPPPGSKHAHQWQTFDFPNSQDLELRLKNSGISKGRIFEPDGLSPIKQAYITIYAADNNLLSQPKVIANAITDHEGLFSTFVPTP